MLAERCDHNYDVRYAVRGAASSSIGMNSVTAIEYQRRVDEISKCKITHNLNDTSCCEQLGLLEPWADSVEIFKDNGPKWTGVITSVEYSRSQVVVEAQDELVFTRYRALTADFDMEQDAAYQFRDLYLNATASDPRPVQILVYPTGIIDKRKYSLSYNRISYFLLKELLESSVDVTMLGQTMHVGALRLGRQINLTAEDFAGDLTVRKAGELFAQQVIVEGARSVQGIYPSTFDPTSSIYPLVQDLVYDEAIQNNEGAIATAKSRYEYSSGVVPRVVRAGDALQLRQGAVDIDRLIPSCIVSLDVSDLCYSDRQQYRLGNVDVTYAGGIETIAISLQPLGTLLALEGITPDDDPGGVVV